MHTFYFGKVNIMPKKFTPEVKAKAVCLVRDHVDDYASEWEAIKTVANRLGMGAERRPQLTSNPLAHSWNRSQFRDSVALGRKPGSGFLPCLA